MVSLSLEFLENVLSLGETEKEENQKNHYASMMNEIGVLNVLQQLKLQVNQEYHLKAISIIEKYFKGFDTIAFLN